MSEKIIQPIKCHGGKYYLAKKIVSLFPTHKVYVEPYFGGGSVLLAKDPESVSEVANDLDRLIANLWHVLGSEDQFPRFLRRVEAIPFAEEFWDRAAAVMEGGKVDPGRASVEYAVQFFVWARQSLAGRCAAFAPLSVSRTRGGMNEQASAWIGAVDGLPAVHARMRRVAVLNRDALDVIRKHDSPHTLTYCDPPYISETRASKAVYRHEATTEHHESLLECVLGCKGMVAVSGYKNPLYDAMLKKWKRHEFPVPNAAAGGPFKRMMLECLWTNWH